MAARTFLFWNPPMIDMAKGRRRSTNREAALIFAELMQRNVRSLAFVRSRRMAELLYVYVPRPAPRGGAFGGRQGGTVPCQLPAGGQAQD